MQRDLSKGSELLIVSDTSMWERNGHIYVFEPALREVEFLTSIFDSITWIGFHYGDMPRPNARSTKDKNIQFVLLPKATGGNSWYLKFKILMYLPKIIFIIFKYLKGAEIIHTRAPSVPALIVILFSLVDSKRKYWHKFAGNWHQHAPPFSYGIQRWFLKRCHHFVAVNGRDERDRDHVRSFENPCFSEQELILANQAATVKSFTGKLSLLFVGRMEVEKGALSLLQAFKELPDLFTLTMVGGGKDICEIRDFISTHKLEVSITGFLSRSEINELYTTSHFLILPTYSSEGFPKVIGEAAGFGCIPVTTSVSVIGKYVHHNENGFILQDGSPSTIVSVLQKLPSVYELKEISTAATKMAGLFTYERYTRRLKEEFLND